MEEMKNSFKIVAQNLKERNNLEDLGKGDIKVNVVDIKWWDMDYIDLAEGRVFFHVLVTQ
jgi:translation elongation factor P/translation initiation factor 5A